MTYAHVTDGQVDAVGNPPALAFDGVRWWDLRPLDGDTLAAFGWFPLADTARPADTDTTTHDRGYTVSGGVVWITWTPRPWTAEEIAAREQVAHETALRDALTAGIAQAVTRRQAIDTAADDLAADLAALGSVSLAALKALGQRVVTLARATADGQQDTIRLARLSVRALDSIDT